MRIPGTTAPPLSAVAPAKKLAVGSAMAALAGATMVLPLLLSWEGLPRPWGFLLGFITGLTGGAGVALAVCGLLQCARGAREG